MKIKNSLVKIYMERNKKNLMKEEFTREDTKIVKGVAIILMLMHHLWAFPNRLAGGSLNYIFDIFEKSSIIYIGGFGQICVSIFFFLSGYGIYISSKNKKLNIIGQIKKIYISYWKVFIIFIPIAFLFFANQGEYCEAAVIYSKYNSFSMQNIINNFFGVSSSLNEEWWFLKDYIFAIISFPLIKQIIDKNKACMNVFLVIVFCIMVTNVFPAISNIEWLSGLKKNYLWKAFFLPSAPFIACFWIGAVFAKDNLIIKLNESIKDNIRLNRLSAFFMIIVIIFLRQTAIGQILDILFVPLFIISIYNLIKKENLAYKFFYNIGKQSTNMWLIHSFFCYYFLFFVKIVIWTKWAIPSLLTLIILSYVASLLLDYFWKIIEFLYKKIFKHKNTGDIQKECEIEIKVQNNIESEKCIQALQK